MRVLICGSRDWAKPIPIDVVVGGFKSVYGPDTVIIHGAARGADSMAGSAAHRHGLPCEDYPAEWDLHGKAAGPIRNQRMLDEGRPEVVVAFTNDLATSRGTADMVRRATAAGLPVYVMGRASLPSDGKPISTTQLDISGHMGAGSEAETDGHQDDGDTCGLCARPQTVDLPMPSPEFHPECGLRSVLGGIGHLTNHPHWCGQMNDPDAGHNWRASSLLVAKWVQLNGVSDAGHQDEDDDRG